MLLLPIICNFTNVFQNFTLWIESLINNILFQLFSSLNVNFNFNRKFYLYAKLITIYSLKEIRIISRFFCGILRETIFVNAFTFNLCRLQNGTSKRQWLVISVIDNCFFLSNLLFHRCQINIKHIRKISQQKLPLNKIYYQKPI